MSASIAAQPAAGNDWTMPAHDAAGTRFSPLTQINAGNAARLRPIWTFSTGVLGGHEGQPLFADGLMYVVTPWPNVVYAFDLQRAGFPLRWKYRPDVSARALGVACCDSVNRGASLASGKLVLNLLDGQTVALDARSGRELWRVRVASPDQGETLTMAPFIARGTVIVGASGGEFGIYGWVRALDLETGAVRWTAHNLGPDRDMRVTEAFHPPYGEARDQGTLSWGGDSWRTGGAPVWGWVSYDAQLDIIYYGTGNPAPYNPEQRPGDNKWSGSVLARRRTDGALLWAYQFTPHDNWDYDATGAMVLVDSGVSRPGVPALVHFDKNGFAYTLDRRSGRLLSAPPFVQVSWAQRIDLVSGRPVLDPRYQTGASKGKVDGICPSLEGGVSPSSPPAYSPRTKLFYSATNNFCMSFAPGVSAYIKGTPYDRSDAPYVAGAGGYLGSFMGWDAARGRQVWQVRERYPVWSGALVTGGDVAFYGTLDGWFKAVDARRGTPLWGFKVGSGVVASPVTFRAPDGRQFVAIYAGIGGDWAGLAGDIRSNDPADLRPRTALTPELAASTSQGGIVWLFGL